MRLFSFEKLDVYKMAINLVVKCYRVTSRYPQEERYGLALHTRKTAISPSNNIAEGTTRISPKDQARFSEYAYSSCAELVNQINVAKALEYLNDTEYQDIRSDIEAVSYKIHRLKESQLRRV